MAQSKQSQVVLAMNLVAGTQKHLVTVTQVTFAGNSYTPAQVVAQIQALITIRQGVNALRAALKTKVDDAKSKTPPMEVFLDDYIDFVRATFAKQADVLADFGLAPKRVPTPRNAEEQAAANAKSKATRQARGTVGKNKKLAIKGNVTGVVVIPVTAPEPKPPVPVASPAQTATSNGAAH